MALFPILTMTTGQQISNLLTIMLCRCMFTVLGSYDDPRMPNKWAHETIVVALEGVAAFSAVKVLDLCKVMKINVFSTDATTTAISRCMQGVSKFHQASNAYILARCSSRTFARAFFESRAYSDKKTIKSKVLRTLFCLKNRAWSCFTTSFNPQRRQRRQFFKRRGKRNSKSLLLKDPRVLLYVSTN